MCGKIVNKEVQNFFKLKRRLTRTLFKNLSFKKIPNQIFHFFFRIAFTGGNSNIIFSIIKFNFISSKALFYFGNRSDHGDIFRIIRIRESIPCKPGFKLF